MAPPTGPRATTATTSGLGPRTTRSNTRGGGIQKRRGGGPGRVDRDGDLSMGAAPSTNGAITKSGSGSNAARRGSRPAGGATQGRAGVAAGKVTQLLSNDNSNKSVSARLEEIRAGRRTPKVVTLRIKGVKESKAARNTDGGLRSLVEFMERKATQLLENTGVKNGKVMIKKSSQDGDTVLVTASTNDALELLKLNGFAFAGSTLDVVFEKEGWLAERPTHAATGGLSPTEIKEKVKEVLGRRYNADQKFLDLSALGQDPTLVEMGTFEAKGRAERLFSVIMVVCDSMFKSAEEKRQTIESISLANNNLENVSAVFDLADTFPSLKNLDLTANAFGSLKSLNKWRHRFKHLQALLLHGNPIDQAEPNYGAEIVEWFPKLQNLNGTQVRTVEQVAAEAAARAPIKIPREGPDFRDIDTVAEQFLTAVFNLYDTNRAALAANFYDEQSSFSISVATHAKRDPNSSAPPASWQSYLKFSRNFFKINDINQRCKRQFKGATILELWNILPATKHPDLKTEMNKYIVACHPVAGLVDPTGQSPGGVDGLVVQAHGEFEEADGINRSMRSFSRTWILGPGLPGRNPIRVLTDTLLLKAHSPIAPAEPSAALPPPPAAPAASTNEQMLVELCKRTNMTRQYSEMCLQNAGWNFEIALVSFEQNKAQLPPDAFNTPAP